MATAAELKLRRGTDAQVAAFTGAAGEVTPDMTNNRLVLHDGTTAGGHPQASEAYVDAAIAAIEGAGGDMLAANNLSDLTNKPLALTNLGGTTVGKALFTAVDSAAVGAAAGVDQIAPKGHLYGLTLSTAGGSFDFSIAAGEAVDANGNLMVLLSAITKSTGSWAVGSGNGGLDTGAVSANGWYHVFLIKRPDTGVVDVIFSTIPSGPTLPANYTMFRRVGAMKIDGLGKWRKFSQNGDEFLWDVRSVDLSSSATSSSASDVTVDTPYPVSVNALCSVRVDYSSAATSVLITAKDESDQAATSSVQTVTVTSSNGPAAVQLNIRTDTSRRFRVRSSGPGALLTITTFGWIDRRGRDG